MPPVEDQNTIGAQVVDVPPEALLRLASDTYDQYETLWIRLSNQYRALTSEYREGEKGGSFGKHVDESHPAAIELETHVEAVKELKHRAELELKRAWRKHPLAPWVKEQVGLGELTVARLLAAIGNPADRPNLYKLWAYCGYAVVNGESQRRRKGQQSNWNETARKRAWLVAVSCKRSGIRQLPGAPARYSYETRKAISPYGELYMKRRLHTSVTHPEWSDGHSEADALRVVAKQVLKDLYFASRQAIREASPTYMAPAGTDHERDNP